MKHLMLFNILQVYPVYILNTTTNQFPIVSPLAFFGFERYTFPCWRWSKLLFFLDPLEGTETIEIYVWGVSWLQKRSIFS
jgi:hypothetical protein